MASIARIGGLIYMFLDSQDEISVPLKGDLQNCHISLEMKAAHLNCGKQNSVRVRRGLFCVNAEALTHTTLKS